MCTFFGWYRVIPTFAPRMATQDGFDAKKTAIKQAVNL